MSKKFNLVVMAIVITMSIGSTSVHADPALDKAKIHKVQTQQNDLENKVEMMDNQIETVISEITKNENSITRTQKIIKQNRINIAETEVNIKAEQMTFDQRMRVMYMGGSSSYIEAILGSKDIDDFISRVEDIEAIIKFDQNIINNFKTKEAETNLKKVALDTQNTNLLSLEVDNKNKLATLIKQKSDEAVLIVQLNAQENQYSAQLVTDQSTAVRKTTVIRQAARATQVASKGQAIARQAVVVASGQSTVANSQPHIAVSQITVADSQVAIENNVHSLTTSRGGAMISSNSVVAYASNFLGTPYVWGGTGPSGFDCSGFTQYVYAHFGINLPRVSEDQQNDGELVSMANLQPGDLVFFGTPAYHVGIYVGNGNMINAPHTGAVIRIQPLDSDFTYGRRVIQ